MIVCLTSSDMPTRTISQSSESTYKLENVLSILHSPSSLIELNPLVISHSLLPSTSPSSTQYTITDSIPPILSFLPSMTTTYSATFTATEFGMKTIISAQMGIESSGKWTFKDGRISEEASITAPFYLINFVENQWKSSHLLLMKRLEEKLRAMEE